MGTVVMKNIFLCIATGQMATIIEEIDNFYIVLLENKKTIKIHKVNFDKLFLSVKEI